MMKSFFSMFVKSAKEFRHIKCITLTGVFVAISMIIEMFSIDLQFVKINFAFIAIAVIGMLFGPVVSMFAGFACDIVGFFVHPTGGFLPAYVLVAGLQGFIYGLVLYHKNDSHSINFTNNESGKSVDITLCLKTIVARLLDIVIINLLLNTKLNLHYGFIPKQAYSAAIISRIAKNMLELCVDLPILFVVLPVALGAYKRIGTERRVTT